MFEHTIAGLITCLAMAGAAGVAEPGNEPDSTPDPKPVWTGAVPETDLECVDSVHLHLDAPQGEGDDYGRAEVGSRRCAARDAPAAVGAAAEPGTMSVERGRGAWVWNDAVWADDPAVLVERASAADLSTLFVAVSIRHGVIEHPRALSRLIELAKAHDLDVSAVEGDPRMISGYGLEHAHGRARALADYNAAHPDARLSGLQYDIEPYLLESYAHAPARTFADWAQALGALSATYGEPVEIVVPFWIMEAPGGAAALAAAAPYAMRFTVMAYRTTPEAIVDAALPVLAWGETRGVPVAVALEMGALPDETLQVYRRDARGELTLSDTGGAAQAQLYDGTVDGTAGQPSFTFSHSVTVPGARISFMGDYAALTAAAEAVEPRFVGFQNYAGLVIHGLIE